MNQDHSCACISTICSRCSLTLQCVDQSPQDSCIAKSATLGSCQANCPILLSNEVLWSPQTCITRGCVMILNCSNERILYRNSKECDVKTGINSGCLYCKYILPEEIATTTVLSIASSEPVRPTSVESTTSSLVLQIETTLLPPIVTVTSYDTKGESSTTPAFSFESAIYSTTSSSDSTMISSPTSEPLASSNTETVLWISIPISILILLVLILFITKYCICCSKKQSRLVTPSQDELEILVSNNAKGFTKIGNTNKLQNTMTSQTTIFDKQDDILELPSQKSIISNVPFQFSKIQRPPSALVPPPQVQPDTEIHQAHKGQFMVAPKMKNVNDSFLIRVQKGSSREDDEELLITDTEDIPPVFAITHNISPKLNRLAPLRKAKPFPHS